MPDQLTHLSELNAVEVSYVPFGAIRKKFLVLKEGNGMIVNLKNLDEILKKSTLKNEDKIRGVLKDAGIAGDDAGAIEACLRVLSSMGDKVSGATLAELNSLIGMAAPSPDPAKVELAAVPPPPAAEDKKPEDDEDKPVMKSDGTVDFDQVPAALRPVLKALWSDKTKTETKLAAVTKELDAERDAKLTREYNETAGELKNLAVKKEDLGAALKSVALAAPKAYDQIHAVLKAANEAVGTGGALREAGSAAHGDTGAGGTVTYAQIEQAAMSQVVAKDGKMGKDAAVTHFISKTADGRRMYSDYVKGKGA